MPPALWAALILVLTSIPAPPDVTGGIPLPHLDKVVHFLLYAGQGWLVTRALRTRRPRSLLVALLGIAIFGAFDEWHQHLLARNPSVADWIADVLGASMGLAVASRVHRVETAQ
jgi:VanZ family protein